VAQLLRRTNASRWQRLRKAQISTELRPPVPIPGAWYDAGYFETGTKSNWQDGYTWPSFAGVFTEAARFLTATFDDATSFLDVGCAKGFLVRALREAGKTCWGVDHSHWALAHAEPAARPYLLEASADMLPLQGRFDVVLAFEVEESQLVDRLSHRGRSDDDPETIRERFRQYKRLTQPVMDYYRRKGLLRQIAAVGTQDEVFARVRSAIDAVK